jgi:hypothetical protein
MGLAVLGELVSTKCKARSAFAELVAGDLVLLGNELGEVVIGRETDLILGLGLERPTPRIELHAFICGWRWKRIDLVRIGIEGALATKQLQGFSDNRVGGRTRTDPEPHCFELIGVERGCIKRHRLSETAEIGAFRGGGELAIQEAAILIAGKDPLDGWVDRARLPDERIERSSRTEIEPAACRIAVTTARATTLRVEYRVLNRGKGARVITALESPIVTRAITSTRNDEHGDDAPSDA